MAFRSNDSHGDTREDQRRMIQVHFDSVTFNESGSSTREGPPRPRERPQNRSRTAGDTLNYDSSSSTISNSVPLVLVNRLLFARYSDVSARHQNNERAWFELAIVLVSSQA